MSFTRFLFVTAVAGLLLGLSCSDLERSNPLDPKNPRSFSRQVVLAELFVNDSVWDTSAGTAYPYSAYAAAALESLYTEFTNTRLVYALYHIGEQFHDSLDLPTNDDYYKQYVAANGGLRYAVPDLFLNGPATRLQGASAPDMVYAWMRTAIAPLLDQRCFFTIEGTLTIDSMNISISSQIARLGETDAPNNLKVQFIIFQDIGLDDHHAVVLYTTSINLPSLAHGEIYQVPGQTIANTKKLASMYVGLIICIKNEQQAVLQAVLVPGA